MRNHLAPARSRIVLIIALGISALILGGCLEFQR
jgi:hypothetical protein